MTLREVLRNLASFSREGAIVAEQPWSATSRASVREFDLMTLVKNMETDGMSYFLEVSVALEVLESLTTAGWRDEDALCQRLITYAINDA
jgi:hypothetical protein